MGIGFAIPTEIVKLVMNGIIKDGKVRRGWLGIELQSSMKDPTKLSDDTQGVEVMNVMPNGPAAKAGLQKGDIITAMDNKPVNDANTLIQMVARKAPNSVVNLQVMRNKAQSSVNVTLGERQPQEALTELPTSQNFDQNNDSANQNGASNEDDIPAELMELLKKNH